MADNRKFVEDALKTHNAYRTRHQVSALKLEKEITAIAQRWAEHLASTGTFQHSNNRVYKGENLGENIAMKWASGPGDYTGQEVTNQWYSEIKQYNFSQGGSGGSGHFTQVVWKSSKYFGIGRARGRDGRWIVVANYFPAGNVIGRYPENVLPPKDGKTSLIGQDGGDASKGSRDYLPRSSNHGYISNNPQFVRQPREHTVRRLTYIFSGIPGAAREPVGIGIPSVPNSTFSNNRMTSMPRHSPTRRVVSRSTKTITEGFGANKRTKTIITETIVEADGSKKITTTETVTSGN